MHKKLLQGLVIITLNFLLIAHTSAMTIDAPLVFDGGARDDAPADGVFDTIFTVSGLADARIQNVTMPTATIEDRIIMEFDLSVIPGGMAITAATLILAESNDDGAPLELFGDVGDGMATTTDAEITNSLTGPAGTFGDSMINTALIDVTSFINGLYLAGDPFALFAIRGGDVGLGSANAVHYRIITSEGGDAPRLSVGMAPVPEPGTLLLLGSGVVGMGTIVRRRNRRK